MLAPLALRSDSTAMEGYQSGKEVSFPSSCRSAAIAAALRNAWSAKGTVRSVLINGVGARRKISAFGFGPGTFRVQSAAKGSAFQPFAAESFRLCLRWEIHRDWKKAGATVFCPWVQRGWRRYFGLRRIGTTGGESAT
jgi:hypothetical protein